jgi:hypothetical protein
MSAQSVCAEIEKHKQDIKLKIEQEKNSVGGFFNNLVNNFSPVNLAKTLTAENNAENTVMQILKNNISQEKSIEINQTCNQGAITSQSNVIDNLQCAVCNGGIIYDKDGKVIGVLSPEHIKALRYKDGKDVCVIQNIKQENESTVKKNCVMSSLITSLMQAQSDTQAQAVTKLMQEASGLLSKNKAENMSCTDIKQDLSQKDYLKTISECAQQSTTEQSNNLKYCGKAIDVIQRNIQDSISDCVISNTANSEFIAKMKTKAETDIEIEQTATGLDLFASLGVFLIPVIIGIVIIFSSSLASSVFFMFPKASSSPNTY